MIQRKSMKSGRMRMMRDHKSRYRLRLSSILLSVILAFGAIPEPVLAETVDISAGSGAVMHSGAEEETDKPETAIKTIDIDLAEAENSDSSGISDNDPETPQIIEIKTAADYAGFEKNCTIDSYTKGKCFVLMNDIDLSGYVVNTIPTFSGIFDGRGHYITGIRYNKGSYCNGIFRYVEEGAVIQDLNVQADIRARDDKEITGGLCAINSGLISDCTFEGQVSGKSITGGIAAINEATGRIKGCTNKGQITGYYYTGGIAGKNYGDIAYSYNKGAVNTTNEWIRGSDAIDSGEEIISDVLAGSFELVKDAKKVRAEVGVDTGGIAGFSRGGIYQCRNYSAVGYEHAGYNIGGIAGRQSGIVSFCVNEGMIYGRKDVGGIVGQMEPNLSLSEMETLPQALDRLHDLVDVTLSDMDDSVTGISGDMDELSGYMDNAAIAGNDLGISAENYLNQTTDTINVVMDKADYVTDTIPGVFDHLKSAGDNISEMSENLNRLMDDVNVYGNMSSKDKKAVREELDSIEQNSKKLAEDLKSLSGNSSESIIERIEKVINTLSDVNSYAGDIVISMNGVSSTMRPYIRSSLKSLPEDTKKVNRSMEDAAKDLKKGMEETRDMFDHLNGMPEARMTHVGSDFDEARESLAGNLSGIAGVLSAMAKRTSGNSHELTEDFSEVNDQMNYIFHLISDEMEKITNISLEKSFDDPVTDVSEEELDMVTAGRVDHCDNKGGVEGDINIGGIAGSLAIDTEDPEENAAGSMDGGFTAKYLLRNVVMKCSNNADITAKKDGVGGIAGYMHHGVVTDCESYGMITSEKSGYVGGIAGQSESVIRDCWAMNFIEGNTCVGGIAGYCTTVANCRAIPVFRGDPSLYGSIAGQVETDKDTRLRHLEVVSDNRFVNDLVAGIDGLSIKGKAEPVSYEELREDEDMPEGFKKLPVFFVVEDMFVSEISKPYGSSFADDDYPVIPPVEGYYVRWNKKSSKAKVTGPCIIEGVPELLEKTLASDEKYPELGVPAGYVSGTFIETDKLSVTVEEENNGAVYEVSYTTDHPTEIKALRLYSPCADPILYGVSDGGVEHRLDGEIKGSYVETKGGLTYNTYRIKNKGVLEKVWEFLKGGSS